MPGMPLELTSRGVSGTSTSSEEGSSDQETMSACEIHGEMVEQTCRDMLDTFCIMDVRRLRRIRQGRVSKVGLGAHINTAVKYMILVLLISKIFDLTTAKLHIIQLWWIPTVLTSALVIAAIAQTVYHPEHTFTLWVSTEIYTLCLWLVWEYDSASPADPRAWCIVFSNGSPMCLNARQFGLSIAFIVVVGLTCLLYIPHRVILPCLLRHRFCQGRCLTWWRSVQRLPTEDGCWHYTYKPSGLLSWKREECMYVGEVDSHERPHGEGRWYDTSFNGECLRGQWENGKPAGAFYSREVGTGAQFLQCAVGYATSRADCQPKHLRKSSFWPRKEDRVRCGLAHVEASFAGGFFPFLPSVEYESDESDTVADMVTKMRENYAKHTDRPHLRLEMVDETTIAEQRSGLNLINQPFYLIEGEHFGYVSETALGNSSQAKREALVFLHGFNCDLATALGRVAQTFSLGNMAPHIVPFVFSYAGGAELSYFPVRSRFAHYGDDFASFLEELSSHFQEVHILAHSCGAEFFTENWERIRECFLPSRAARGPQLYSRWITKSCGEGLADMEHQQQPQQRKMHLATLTMINPDVLEETMQRLLKDIMGFAEHFTSYNDSNDGALFYSEHCRRAMDWACGEGCQPKTLFGKSLTSYWMERDSQSSQLKWQNGLSSRQALGRNSTQRLSGLGGEANLGSSLLGAQRIPGDGTIDIIDCSNIEQNVHKLRHNYYMLNTQMVEDVCELVGQRLKAQHRTRLCQHGDSNVFSFLSPPGFLKS